MHKAQFVEVLFVLVISFLIIPPIVANRGNIYGVCSQRFQFNQRLFLPTLESAGHFLQALVAMLMILLATDRKKLWICALGLIGIFVYPVYNIVKRNLPGHGKGLGLNNTSYANNLFDFLLGVWIGVLISTVIRSNGDALGVSSEARDKLLITAIVVLLVLNGVSMFMLRPPLDVSRCPKKPS